jgi:sporulation protein YlmC with PRC-barrel domain
MTHSSPLFISDLLGCKIVTAEGKTLGHVLDIQLTHTPACTIHALLYGHSGLLHHFHMLNPFRNPHANPPPPTTIPWTASPPLSNASFD